MISDRSKFEYSYVLVKRKRIYLFFHNVNINCHWIVISTVWNFHIRFHLSTTKWLGKIIRKLRRDCKFWMWLAKHMKDATQEKLLKYFECICILLRTFCILFVNHCSQENRCMHWFFFSSIILCKFVCICKKRDSRAGTNNSLTSKLERSTVQLCNDLQEEKQEKGEHSVGNLIDKQKYVNLRKISKTVWRNVHLCAKYVIPR